ncbi:hypothetical protein KY315_01055 [Candidatus Woesearchaeota archaeon]|nr:hypothetical protein [Candidatus Woesearchaeota archaeon]MBW2993989.1 hypothetical protein [Candidatus Woesearchaeota archaeon]
MEQEIIQFVGVKDLEPMEQETVQRLTTENYEKIKRALKNITSLKVHVKMYKKEGEQKKFSMHVQAIYPGGTIESNKSHDFELPKALHQAFADVLVQIEHKFHTADQK